MSRIAIVSFLFFGCTAPQGPRTYEDGAFPSVRPAPSVTRLPPGAPRPRLGGVQPEPFDPYAGVPRSADKRELPPTREPGIWAAGLTDPADKMPSKTILEVPLPEADDSEARKIRRVCARTMNLAIRLGEFEAFTKRLSEQDRRCLAARLYHHCASELLADFERTASTLPPTIPVHVIMGAMRAAEPVALDFLRRECDSRNRTSREVDVLAHDVAQAWRDHVINEAVRDW